MHRPLKELEEFVAQGIKLSAGTMPLTLVARDPEEEKAIKGLLKGKRNTKLLTIKLDPSVLDIKGIGKGSKNDDSDDQHPIPAPDPASKPTTRRSPRKRQPANAE